jgi:hypothetical protein
MTSAYIRIEGDSVKNRLWSFLIIHAEFDYSMKDIAKFSNISYSSMKLLWNDFVKRKLVVHTRNVGNAKMYQLNRDNPVVERFIDYYWAVVEEVAQKVMAQERKAQQKEQARRQERSLRKNHVHASARAITASAKKV